MTVQELLNRNGFDVRGRSVRCPFHGDNSPSAMVNENGIWCFVCGWHGVKEIAARFSVPVSSIEVKEQVRDSTDHWKEPLFEE